MYLFVMPYLFPTPINLRVIWAHISIFGICLRDLITICKIQTQAKENWKSCFVIIVSTWTKNWLPQLLCSLVIFKDLLGYFILVVIIGNLLPLLVLSWWSGQTSYIRRTKSQNESVSRIVLQFSLSDPLKPSVKSRMKMELEQRRQAMLQLHLSDQWWYCLLRCGLY